MSIAENYEFSFVGFGIMPPCILKNIYRGCITYVLPYSNWN